MKIKGKLYPICLVSGILFVFGYFWVISNLTPLAGDDWGYALNGMTGNPFKTLLDFYMSWSGRLISELWGLLVACRKDLWNVLNALLYAGIFFAIAHLGNDKKKISAIGLILFLMFSVSEYLRMETYTWIMGTTYVIPLFLSLVYFSLIEKHVFKNLPVKGMKLILLCILCFAIGITMENIAAIMLVGHVLILGYVWFKTKAIRKDFCAAFVCSAAGLAVMRLSPGSTFRTARDHGAWIAMSLFEKIEGQLSNFFRYTFIENKYLIFILGLVMLGLLASKGLQWWKKHPKSTILVGLFNALAVFFACANVLASKASLSFLSVLVNPDSLLVRVWWIVYVVETLAAFSILIDKKEDCAKAWFFLMMGGACNMVMLYSPIFGSRSSLYFVYFMFVVICVLYSQIDMKWDILDVLILCGLAVLLFGRGKNWLIKYRQVHQVQLIRDEEIKYYRTHPDEDAWIVRMPPYSIHSGDVEDDDPYHQEVFKAYFGLDPDQKLIFYWAESYD